MSVSLLFCDVDRTLLTHDYRIHERVAAAVARARDAGLRIVLATARSPLGVRSYALELGLPDPCICFGGGWIGHVGSGETVLSRSIDRQIGLDFAEAAGRLGANPMWYTPAGVYGIGGNETMRKEALITGEPLSFVSSANRLPGAPHKIMCVSGGADREQIFQKLEENATPRLEAARSGEHLLEILPRGTSKQLAAEMVAKTLGVPAERCAAAGDAANDLSLLHWAKVRLTVANAIDPIRNIAHFCGGSCDDGGLADAVDWLMQ